MLTSTKRRVLNVICLTLAVASVAYGLVLRYDKSKDKLNNTVVQESEEIIAPDRLGSELVLKANNPLTNPN